MRHAIIATVMFAACASPTIALDDPDQLIKSLYALDQVPTKSREIDRYFARDLAAAIKKDIAPRDEVGETNGGDYRYNAQEFQISDLTYLLSTNRAGGTVSVSFKNFGEAETVHYDMCLARRGWRISNVRATGWEMREVLELPTVPVRC